MLATTHRVIVTDPITNAVFESGVLFPIIAAAVVFVVLFIAISTVMERFVPYKKRKQIGFTIATWAIPIIGAVITFNHFNI